MSIICIRRMIRLLVIVAITFVDSQPASVAVPPVGSIQQQASAAVGARPSIAPPAWSEMPQSSASTAVGGGGEAAAPTQLSRILAAPSVVSNSAAGQRLAELSSSLPLPPNGYSYQATSGQQQPPGYASGYGGYPAQAMAAASFPATSGGSSYTGGSVPVAAFATLTADGSRDQVAGVPDTSDPCFRRYTNTIIVNAQPYERRSSTALSDCKKHCLLSQVGVYSCRSFVYDNVNQVCDLFAHVGDQSPAKLLKFQGRDYFEPTAAISCATMTASVISTTTLTPPPVTTSADVATTTVSTGGATSPRAAISTTLTVDCPTDQSTRFLRIEGFQLAANDDVTLTGLTVDQCLEACTRNEVRDGQSTKCQSFDYTAEKCVLSHEAGVPLGNGQLTQDANSDYYEKICVPANSVVGCPTVFDRFPQMILVGFAETVVDADTFEQCLDSCLNSQNLYGFRCTSGMFYFEEPQLNCILNTEDRSTQPDLFTEENVDIVDYFETGCIAKRSKSTRKVNKAGRRDVGVVRQAVLSDPELEKKQRGEGIVMFNKDTFADAGNNNVVGGTDDDTDDDDDENQWTEWTACDRTVDGRRSRRKRKCLKQTAVGGEQSCGPVETQWCNRKSDPQNILNLDALNFASTSQRGNSTGVGSGFKCAPDVCCAIFGGCRIGLLQNSIDKKIRWCTNPC